MVLGVNYVWNVSQICYCVVRCVAVNVVNLVFGPLSVEVKPRQSVQGYSSVANLEIAVTALIDVSSRLPNKLFAAFVKRFYSCKHPGFLVIRK